MSLHQSKAYSVVNDVAAQNGPPESINEIKYGEGGIRAWLLFSLLASAIFLMNGSYSIVMTVMPDIARDLNVQVSDVVWVSNTKERQKRRKQPSVPGVVSMQLTILVTYQHAIDS